MEVIKSYTELDVWQKCRNLVLEVYKLTSNFPVEEQYGLTNQITRCATSVPSNIAEGCGREHPKDSIRFFHIARGSLYELETQLFLSKDLSYISEEQLDRMLAELTVCKKLLNGLIRYYKTL